MADACKLTAGAGGGKGLEQAMGQTIKGKCESEYQEKKHCILLISFGGKMPCCIL